MASAVQRIDLDRPVVEPTEHGARSLADAYWAAIRRLTAGLVGVRHTATGPELRFARSITLFRFGPPLPSFGAEYVECRFAIVGGLLAKEEGGWLTFTQRTSPQRPELEVSVEEYVPRLSSLGEHRSLRRFTYRQIQERAHKAIGRRYLERMAGRAG